MSHDYESCYRVDQPIINERFDESLVMLKRKFCWSYLDIFYQKQEVSNGTKFTLSKQERSLLLSAGKNLGDKLLYDALVSKWWSQPEIKQPDFWAEVCCNIVDIIVIVSQHLFKNFFVLFSRHF